MADIEIWKDIEGWEGKYQVSNFGNIKSIKWGTKSKETIFTPWINHAGYSMVTLRKNGSKKGKRVSVIVWETFNGPVPEGMQVNHIDEDKTNNSLLNLNLMSPKDNCNWGTRNKRIAKNKKIPVTQILPDGIEFYTFFSARDAEAETGIWHQNITQCCKGKQKTAGGFKWCYAS